MGNFIQSCFLRTRALSKKKTQASCVYKMCFWRQCRDRLKIYIRGSCWFCNHQIFAAGWTAELQISWHALFLVFLNMQLKFCIQRKKNPLQHVRRMGDKWPEAGRPMMLGTGQKRARLEHYDRQKHILSRAKWNLVFSLCADEMG